MEDNVFENLHEVDFEKYCARCEYKTDKEDDPKSPCWDCLYEPANVYSRKPVNFKEKS